MIFLRILFINFLKQIKIILIINIKIVYNEKNLCVQNSITIFRGKNTNSGGKKTNSGGKIIISGGKRLILVQKN